MVQDLKGSESTWGKETAHAKISNERQPNIINAKCETKHLQKDFLLIPTPKLCFLYPLPWWISLPPLQKPKPEMFISPPPSPYIYYLATGPIDFKLLALSHMCPLPNPTTLCKSRLKQCSCLQICLFVSSLDPWNHPLSYLLEIQIWVYHFLNGLVFLHSFQGKAQPPEHNMQNLHDPGFVHSLNLFSGVLVNV